MIVFLVIAGSVVVTGCGLWKVCGKDALQRQLAALVGTLGPKALGGSKCEASLVEIGGGEHSQVSVFDLKIDNLEGFSSEFLLKANRITVQVDVGAVLRSMAANRGKPTTIEIPLLKIEGVMVVYERSLTTSNVQALLDALEHRGQESKDSETALDDSKTTKEQESQVNLRRVQIDGVELKFATALSESLGLKGSPLVVAPIEIEDFAKEFGLATGHYVIAKLVESVLLSTLRSLLDFKNTLGDAGSLALGSVESLTASIQAGMEEWGACSIS